jgi:hypothetical protein
VRRLQLIAEFGGGGRSTQRALKNRPQNRSQNRSQNLFILRTFAPEFVQFQEMTFLEKTCLRPA